jgi:RND family efflux transporter MFP subunit
MKMNRIKRFLLTLGLALTLATGCKRHHEAGSPASTLPTAAVRIQTIDGRKRAATEETMGTVRSKLQARLEAKLPGRIEQMRAAPGQRVKTGEVLIRLHVEEIGAKLDQALAVQRQTAADLQRHTALLERGAATRAEFDTVQSRARLADAAVREAEAMLSYVEITAPFDGVITRKMADVGDLATPGKPLVELEDPAALRVEAAVGEALISHVHLSQTVDVQVSNLAEPLRGTVVEIAPSADSASRTFLVKLDLPPTSGLRAGSFARVAIPIGDTEVLTVPAEAVIRRGQLEYIFVAVDGRAQLRLVKSGARHGDEVELLAGASAGDRVVVSGGSTLQEGQPLQIQP